MAASFCANAVTKGFFAGTPSMNPSICLTVAATMNAGGINPLAACLRDSAVTAFLHARALTPWPSRREVIHGVLLGQHGMADGHGLDQTNVGAVHLFEGEREVEKRLLARHQIELPLHEVGGETLGVGHLGAVELRQRGESLAGEANAVAFISDGLRRERALQAILLVAGEVAGAGGEVRVAAHPLGGENAEEIVDIGSGVCDCGRRLAAQRENKRQKKELPASWRG